MKSVLRNVHALRNLFIFGKTVATATELAAMAIATDSESTMAIEATTSDYCDKFESYTL